jgi:hypothetical protein
VSNRQRAKVAGLRSEIDAQVHLATTLKAARVYLITSSVRRDGHAWFSLRGPRRLIVGADACAFEAPSSLREYVCRGSDCSIAFSQAPSSAFVTRDWIIITGLATGRKVQLAISNDNLMDIFQALAAAGAAT